MKVPDESLSGSSVRDKIVTAAQGNRPGRGLDRLCYEGLLKRAVGGYRGLSPQLGKMALGNKTEAYNLPQGTISQLFRDTAAGKPGLLTRVGLGTFVDPRHGGGKINERTTEARVELITLDGEEYLLYKSLQLDVAFLRGTTADPGEHHHGARGADIGGPRGGHRGAQRRWLAGAEMVRRELNRRLDVMKQHVNMYWRCGECRPTHSLP